MDFVRWMNGIWGRLARVVAGAALIIAGFTMMGVVGVVLMVVGFVVLMAGATGTCLFAPLMGVSARAR